MEVTKLTLPLKPSMVKFLATSLRPSAIRAMV
jgi:hypothetical protein